MAQTLKRYYSRSWQHRHRRWSGSTPHHNTPGLPRCHRYVAKQGVVARFEDGNRVAAAVAHVDAVRRIVDGDATRGRSGGDILHRGSHEALVLLGVRGSIDVEHPDAQDAQAILLGHPDLV